MKTIINQRSLIFIVPFTIISCVSFSPSTYYSRKNRTQILQCNIRTLSRQILKPIRQSQHTNDIEIENDNGWTLEQDWALIDSVPIFTVGESEEMKCTFWTQLFVSTPMLSSKSSEDDLIQRYGELRDEKKDLPRAGKAPQILEDWSLDESGRVMGNLNGRTVWFVSNMMGRIDGNSFENNPYLPGGFVEAVGGRIYELGQPDSSRIPIKPSLSFNSFLSNGNNDGKSESDDGFLGIPWLTGRNALTATASALFASAILSFAVGYGAGLTISSSSRESSLVRTKSALTTTSNVRVMERSSYAAFSGPSERTISEKRAIKEAQVLSEKRRVQFLLDKLEKDQVELKQLLQDESSQNLMQPQSNP